MGSSSKNGDHSPKKRRSSSSDSSSDSDKENNHNHNLNNRPPPAGSIHPDQGLYPMPMPMPMQMPPPPNTMGYPPQPGYGYGQQNYCNPHPQPYAGYPNGYPPGHGHPNAYYYPQGAAGGAHYGSATTMQQYNSATTGFLRGFILCSFFLLMFLFVCSAILSLNLQPEAPRFTVESFSVSNFNTGNSSLTADWVSKITTENPNKKLNAFFSNWKVTVVHNHVEMAHSFWMGGFELETQQNRQIDVVLPTNSQNSTQPISNTAVEDIAKEQAKGSITIGLGISTLINFRHESFVSRSIPVYAYCKDLKLDFQGKSNNATALLNEENKKCELVDEGTVL